MGACSVCLQLSRVTLESVGAFERLPGSGACRRAISTPSFSRVCSIALDNLFTKGPEDYYQFILDFFVRGILDVFQTYHQSIVRLLDVFEAFCRNSVVRGPPGDAAVDTTNRACGGRIRVHLRERHELRSRLIPDGGFYILHASLKRHKMNNIWTHLHSRPGATERPVCGP